MAAPPGFITTEVLVPMEGFIPAAEVVQEIPFGATQFCPPFGPVQVPLFPPIFFDERRRPRREEPGISLNVVANQTLPGVLMLDGENWKRGDIERSGNSILVRRRGRYLVDLNVNVRLIPALGSDTSTPLTATATFMLSPSSTQIAGITVSSPTTQVLSGSQVLDLHKNTYISVIDNLANATVLNGTFSVQMIAEDRGRRRVGLQ